MNILGIDYSLNGTGLSIFNGETVIFKKVFTSIRKNYQQDNQTFILSPKFDNSQEKVDWVCSQIINSTNYDMVCMEDHIGSYYEWMDGYAIIKHYLRKNNIPYLTVSPTQLKKYAGSGKADKTQMSYYLRKDYNIDFDYLGDCANNIVDATWLSILGYNFYMKMIHKKKIKDNQVRLEILNKLKDRYFGGNDFVDTNKR